MPLDSVQQLHHSLAMPAIKRFGKCKICMYFADHGAPHFHGWDRMGSWWCGSPICV